jgi:ABC-type nitrate/sulfonate/bicarbonate transport system ATPase subunit
METDILLMDEPFSALDYRNRCLLQDLLAELWLSTGKTVVFVTHDIDEAMLLSSRILFIDGVRAFPSVPMESPQPRPRSVLTTPEFCGIRKHFINLFNGGELFGVPAL